MIKISANKATLHGTTFQSNAPFIRLEIDGTSGEVDIVDNFALKFYRENLAFKKQFKCIFQSDGMKLEMKIKVMEFSASTYFMNGELRSGMHIKFKIIGA